LIDFSESREAIQKKEFNRAWDLANKVHGEAKRSLLYIGVMSVATPDRAIEEVYLALKETESLSPEQRVAALSAIGAAILPINAESARSVASQAVKVQNDASLHPHSRKFDPKSIHKTFNANSDPSTDATLIVFGKSSFYEAVEAGVGRHNFRLNIPGVTALRLPTFISMARGIDPDLLEATLVSIHDETRQAEALNALAKLRLRSAK